VAASSTRANRDPRPTPRVCGASTLRSWLRRARDSSLAATRPSGHDGSKGSSTSGSTHSFTGRCKFDSSPPSNATSKATGARRLAHPAHNVDPRRRAGPLIGRNRRSGDFRSGDFSGCPRQRPGRGGRVERTPSEFGEQDHGEHAHPQQPASDADAFVEPHPRCRLPVRQVG